MKKLNQRIYSKEKFVDRRLVENPDGFLYADRTWPTKIRPEDLPPSYVYGRFYATYSYMDTSGITDLRYNSSRFSNHYLKDDCLMIAYGGKIEPVENPPHTFGYVSYWDAYTGYDECVWGNEILTIVAGVIVFSGYDAGEIIKQLKDKVVYMRETFPDEFGDFHFDVDAYLQKEINELQNSKERKTMGKNF